MRASAVRPPAGWLGLIALVAALASCAFTFDQPPPQFGFFSANKPWTVIPGVDESYRGEMMWAGVSDSSASQSVTTITADAAGVFSIWVYSDPAPGALTIHLAVAALGDESVSYGVGALLEPTDTSYQVYRGMRKVKRYDFYATDEVSRLIAEHQDRKYQGVLVLNSPQQGLALIRLDRSGRRRSTSAGEQQGADGGSQAGIGEFQPPEIDLPAPPEIDLPLPSAVEFGYPVMGYGAGTYGGRIFGAKNPPGYRLPFHIGEDVRLEPGTAVSAVADGTVVLSGPADGYGDAVVVIEHVLSDGTVLNSIYGHLSARDGYQAAPVRSEVVRGQTIGYVGWDDLYPGGDSAENGDGGPHLHLGIRVVGQQRDYTPGVRGNWYHGNGTASDMGQLSRQGDYGGGPYISFTDLMRYSYRGLTMAAGGGNPWEMRLD